ncbi:MAG: rod shape-determining protein MreC [Chloroflexi bacterium]|nr:rod shape-determining protein MreC [Chloroflexota bacterium]
MRARVWFWLSLSLGVVALLLWEEGWIASGEDAALPLLAPVQQGLTQAFDFLSNLPMGGEGAGGRSAPGGLVQENQRLRAEVARLWELEQENQRLRQLLNFQRDQPGQKFVVASVVGRDTNNLRRSIMVNRGRQDGLEVGMVVVAQGGLVGKVSQVLDSYARVLLIADPASSVNALVQPSRVPGVVVGQWSEDLEMKYVSQQDEVKVGDLVVTSGLGGGFPKGLLIGQVVWLRGDKRDMFREVRVRAAVSLDHLEEVMITTDFRPAAVE